MDSLFEVTNEAQLKTMKDEVEREHFRLIEETERKIVEEEMLRLKEKLDLQQREVCQSLMQKNLPYFLDLVQQLEVGLLSHNACSWVSFLTSLSEKACILEYTPSLSIRKPSSRDKALDW